MSKLVNCSDLQSLHKCTTAYIFDDGIVSKKGDWFAVVWRGNYSESLDCDVSISDFLEKNSEALKKTYLKWIYDLGRSDVLGMNLVDHLELRPGLSYWWMTLISQKCNFSSSPQIDDVMRFMAFNEWANINLIDKVIIETANPPLAECIRSWCENLGCEFEWRRVAVQSVNNSWSRFLNDAMPHIFQALTALICHIIDRWPLRGAGLENWRSTKGGVTFFSYLFNLDPDVAIEGQYKSHYWANLPEYLKDGSVETNWLHIFVKDKLLPNSTIAAKVISAFNRSSHGVQNHVTLDTFLSFSVIFHTLLDWCKLIVLGISLKKSLQENISGLNLWPFLVDDWSKSFFGKDAIINLLNLNLIEVAVNSLPPQRRGAYLQENQAWEIGLIAVWKAAGHNNLIGAPHSTVRFWDFRYFFDPQCYLEEGKNKLPMPWRVAVNGEAAYEAYKNGGYPDSDLVQVEALRYLHLGKIEKEVTSLKNYSNNPVRLLVLGDYLISNTKLQMNLLSSLDPSLLASFSIMFKPHPNCPINSSDYPSLNMNITMEPIATLLDNYDVAYCSSSTSAAVDAYCSGLMVISFLNPSTLNLSPLRGYPGALFASTPLELMACLNCVGLNENFKYDYSAFFNTDPQLPAWKSVLFD